MSITKLITLANKLDQLNLPHIANKVDFIIKTAQLQVNPDDLSQAIQFYNDVNLDEINPDNLVFDGISFMAPEDFLPDLDITDKGWLKSQPKEKWPELMTSKHGRNFTHIINLYNSNKMNPAIQTNGEFADGMARAIFYNAIGEDMPVANYITTKNTTQ